jgi:hypothetical protein
LAATNDARQALPICGKADMPDLDAAYFKLGIDLLGLKSLQVGFLQICAFFGTSLAGLCIALSLAAPTEIPPWQLYCLS